MSALTQSFPEASDPVISVRGLYVAFRANRSWNSVVRDLSFDIASRETLALVGESGSGKSVTALSLMRLLPPGLSQVTGSVQMGGRDLLAVPYRQMRHVRGNEVAMIFQEPMSSLNPLFTVGHQITEAVRAHRRISFKAAKAEALQLMERVRIPSAASRFSEYPHRFSGGMRQRIMIAMALASRPKLLIADEPTTALDVTIQGQILDLIKTLQDEDGTAVLFITHDMGVVAEVADRTLVMYQGDPVESGPTVDLFGAAQAGYTRALLAAVPALGSMGGVALPLRFPVIDMESGMTRIPATVAPETRPEGAAPLLEARGLGIKFGLRGGVLGRLQGRVHAVENVSFKLQPGETLSLVGESGCGKSTTARLVMRLLEPSTGEVLLDGMEITGRADLRQMRRRMQMIFQDPFASLNPRMKVGESVTEAWCDLGLGPAAASRHRAEELLEQVGLAAEMAERFPHELSGGQRQRVCIARALALDPAVLVLDEAVSALDASVKAQVVNLLLDLQARLGLSYLFISHDMAVVERVSHRVAVMYLGEIVEQGDRQAIFDAPRHPYTRRLIGAVPVPDPSRRGTRLNLPAQELTTTVRSLDYVPPLRSYTEVAPGHIVQDH